MSNLQELLAQAKATFDHLSPEEQAAHRREQAISFAYGNLKLSGSQATRNQIAKAYDDLEKGYSL